MTADEHKKLVTELRDAAETALDFWSNDQVRERSIAEALEAASALRAALAAEPKKEDK